jgi:pyruvate-ferredoxin/flavodoxin oxidoreductase
MPHSVQQALDLTLLARWVAERSLIPGMVALDRRLVEHAAFPTPEAIREFLGLPDDEIPSPNPAQLLLFGGRRRAIPAWFDPDRPVSFGSLQGSSDAASAAVGRQAFFLKHLPDLLREGMDKLGRLTGRPLDLVDADQVETSDLVLVTQGSAIETARAASRYLRQTKGWQVGVLGITWLRPFPSEPVHKLLKGKRGVAVLECATAALAEEGTLAREVRRAASDSGAVWISAGFGLHGQPLAVGQVIELVSELREKKPRSRVWLGIVSGPAKIGDFPKREGLVKSVVSDYPELAQNTISARDVEKLSSQSVKTLQWIGGSDVDASRLLEKLAQVCLDNSGPKVRGFAWFPEPGVLSARVSAGPSELPIAEAGSAVDVLILGRLGLDVIYNPLAEMREGQSVVLETDRSPQEIWELMPDFWRSEVRRLKLRLFRVEGDLDQLLSGAGALLSGAVDLPFSEIDWSGMAEPSGGTEEPPRLIRRVKEARSEYDNLPRFWGEVMQPKRGGISDNFPDPLVTVGAVPPYTAALARPRATALPTLPVLDVGKCTGCGHCWPVCPDSAIGATLIGLQEMLDAGADLAGAEGKIAGAVKRSHRAVAARLAGSIGRDRPATLDEALLVDSFDAVLGKMSVAEEERPQHRAEFRKTAAVVAQLRSVVCETLFHGPENEEKGTGQLLVLTINPDACQGCRLCIESCPESALVPEDRGGPARLEGREAWKLWEMLPDTGGAQIQKAAERLELGSLAARLLSRHSSQVQAVGSFGEPGSGERLACRLVAAVVESRLQARLAEQAREVGELASKLREQVQALLGKGLSDADPKAVQEALESLPRRRASLSELSERLSSLGRAVSIDPVRTLRVAETAHDLEDEQWQLTEGVHGLGRSRFGLVVVSHRVARWAGRFPNHPYHAPLVVEPSPEGAGLVVGLAEAAMHRHVERIRRYRKGRLYVEDPADLPGRLAKLEELSWDDLTDEERRLCPPLLVFADETGLTRQGLGALSRLLSGRMPVKLVLLDAKVLDPSAPEPALLTLAFSKAFVLASSLGYLEHLAGGLDRAVDFPGPAVIHVNVPIPREHGFEPSQTLKRAREAVRARVQPLFVYDPSAEGDFGLRMSLEGNPGPEADWAGLSPVEWALGETRFRRLFSDCSDEEKTAAWEDFLSLSPEDRTGVVPALEREEGGPLKIAPRLVEAAGRRLQIWKILKEMVGISGPFVDRIRDQVEVEVESRNQHKFEELKRESDAKVAALKRDFDARMANQLRDRLLTLAGFGPDDTKTGRSDE